MYFIRYSFINFMYIYIYIRLYTCVNRYVIAQSMLLSHRKNEIKIKNLL